MADLPGVSRRWVPLPVIVLAVAVQLGGFGALATGASEAGADRPAPQTAGAVAKARSAFDRTTTTQAPPPAPEVAAPPTTVAPVVAPATTVPPPPPAPAPAPPVAAPVSAADRVAEAFTTAVPASWRTALPVALSVIEGNTSWAHPDGRIEIARVHAEGSWSHLLSVTAHEFGHQVAFRYGSGAYDGAPPDGWPGPDQGDGAEAWADCVAQAFTGIVDPSYDLAPCPQSTVDWTAAWLSQPH